MYRSSSPITETEACCRKKSRREKGGPRPVSAMASIRPSAHSRQSSSAVTDAPRRESNSTAASPNTAPGFTDAATTTTASLSCEEPFRRTISARPRSKMYILSPRCPCARTVSPFRTSTAKKRPTAASRCRLPRPWK